MYHSTVPNYRRFRSNTSNRIWKNTLLADSFICSCEYVNFPSFEVIFHVFFRILNLLLLLSVASHVLISHQPCIFSTFRASVHGTVKAYKNERTGLAEINIAWYPNGMSMLLVSFPRRLWVKETRWLRGKSWKSKTKNVLRFFFALPFPRQYKLWTFFQIRCLNIGWDVLT